MAGSSISTILNLNQLAISQYSTKRARVRSRAIGGRREVEIVAVPDDAHVTLRPEGGDEITVALDDIHEATLVAELAPAGKPGPKGTGKRNR